MEKAKINFRGILKGIIFSIITTIILVVIIALISYFADISDKIISILLFIASVLSVFAGSMLMTRTAGGNGLAHGALIGFGYFIIILIASIVVKREFDLNGNLITLLIANAAGGMLGGIVGINSKD